MSETAWEVGDVFTTPPDVERFPGRPVQVVQVTNVGGMWWLDVQPVDFHPDDRYAHGTVPLDENDEPWWDGP